MMQCCCLIFQTQNVCFVYSVLWHSGRAFDPWSKGCGVNSHLVLGYFCELCDRMSNTISFFFPFPFILPLLSAEKPKKKPVMVQLNRPERQKMVVWLFWMVNSNIEQNCAYKFYLLDRLLDNMLLLINLFSSVVRWNRFLCYAGLDQLDKLK